jgi:hypothetical protein
MPARLMDHRDNFPPDQEVFVEFVDNWIHLQGLIEEAQAKYRRDVEKNAANYNKLMRELEPYWSEQKAIFWGHPFELMVWEHYVKPFLDEGGTDWRVNCQIPGWIWKVWESQ